jgi:hypothetical protein
MYRVDPPDLRLLGHHPTGDELPQRAHDGPSLALRRRLQSLARASEKGAVDPSIVLKAGTTLVRQWRGHTLRNWFADSPLEEAGFEPVWGFFCQVVFLVCWRFFVRSGKAVLRPVVCDQVRGARGRGQGTETLAELSGLPLRGLCLAAP